MSEQTTEAERDALHGREPLHDRPPPGHALHARREHNGQDGGRPRARGDRKGHADEHDRDHVGGVLEVGGEHDRGHDHERDHDHGDAEGAADPVDLALERRLLRLGLPEQPGHVAISVAIPVAVTTALPRVTAVPLKTMFTRSPRPAGPARGATSFSTASLSPVSDASASVSEAASSSRASALTRPPSARSRMSPGTRSAVAIRSSRPSRAHPCRGGGHPLQRRHRLLGAGLLHIAENGSAR